MGRAPCCDKANVKKGPWSPEEDAKLKSYIEQHGTGGNWITLPQKIGLKRCGKSCRLRWLNYLRPNIKHGGFSEEEDNIICSLYMSIGSRWSIIAAQLPGRTDNDIKNYWNTRLKKKLLGKPRKDLQQSRRSSKEANGGGQAAYWPELPPPPGHYDHFLSDDNSSLRKFLVKLCGRFAAEEAAVIQTPLGGAAPQVYDGLQDLVDTSAWNYSFPHDCSSLEGSFSYPELTQAFYSEHMKIEGMDNLWGIGSTLNEASCVSSAGSSNWNNLGALMNPPLDEQAQLGTC